MIGDSAETLTARLEDSVPDLQHPADRLRSIGRRVQRRKRRNLAIRSASAVAAVAIGVAVAPSLSGLRHGLDSEPALGSASAVSLETADWTRAVIDLPASGADGCPTGRTALKPKTYPRFGTVGEAVGAPSRDGLTFQVLNSPKVFGDLTGDGRPEAVLRVRCAQAPDGNLMVDEGSELLVVEYTGGGSVRGLGYIGPRDAQFPRYWISDRKLYVQARYQQVSDVKWSYNRFDVGYRRTFVWEQGGFRQVDGRSSPLTFEPDGGLASAPIRLADIMNGDKVVCGRATLTLQSRSVTVSSTTYSVQPITVTDLDHDGNDEVLASVRCRTAGYDAASIYLFSQAADGFVPIDLPFANDGRATIGNVVLKGEKLTVTYEGDTGKHTASMSWGSHRFSPSIGTYRR